MAKINQAITIFFLLLLSSTTSHPLCSDSSKSRVVLSSIVVVFMSFWVFVSFLVRDSSQHQPDTWVLRFLLRKNLLQLQRWSWTTESLQLHEHLWLKLFFPSQIHSLCGKYRSFHLPIFLNSRFSVSNLAIVWFVLILNLMSIFTRNVTNSLDNCLVMKLLQFQFYATQLHKTYAQSYGTHVRTSPSSLLPLVPLY